MRQLMGNMKLRRQCWSKCEIQLRGCTGGGEGRTSLENPYLDDRRKPRN